MTFVISNVDEIDFKNCQFTTNNFTAIGSYRSKMTFWGIVQIERNTGINGGGLLLCESSYVMLTNHSIINFIQNHALVSGGGIYIESECFHSKPFCFFQLNNRCDQVSKQTQIFMINNSAVLAGDHIYGGALDNCYINNYDSVEVFESLFTITPNGTDSNPSAITSDARKICYCMDGELNCANGTIIYPESVFPGEVIEFRAVIVGQFHGTVPGTVLIHSKYSENARTPQTTQRTCTALYANVTSKEEMDHVVVVLQLLENVLSPINNSISVTEPLHLLVPVKPCPLGFRHTNYSCNCDEVLTKNKVKCDISAGKALIFRNPPEWVGYVHMTDEKTIIYHDVCPYDYCHYEPVNIMSSNSVFNQDSQCAPNRTGVLCGRCKVGYSLNFGTSDCTSCPNGGGMAALTILGLGLGGILLVLFLTGLDFTYTEGTMSGLLFYINTIHLNNSIFLPFRFYSILTVTLSWINLSPGLRVCFYDGMNAYAKAWFSFCFPLYLFLIAAIIILLCRKSSKCALWFGGNIVKVLATLFLLSYTDLIQSIVIVFSSTVIHFTGPNHSNHRVWLYDPSLEYFSGKHLLLALFAIVLSFFILAYTLVLLFVQPLQHYSHLPCFKWMAKIKPFIDAYTSPHIIRDNCRNWEGLLLLFRLILVGIFAANVKRRIDTNLTVITSVCVLLLSISWSMGGVYKKLHLNALNCASFLNLAALSIAVNYMNKTRSYAFQLKKADSFITYYISFTVALFIFFSILILKVFKKIKLCCMKCKRKEYQNLRELNTSSVMPSLREHQEPQTQNLNIKNPRHKT